MPDDMALDPNETPIQYFRGDNTQVAQAPAGSPPAPAQTPAPTPAPVQQPPIQFFRTGQQEPIVVPQGDAQPDAGALQIKTPPPPPKPVIQIDFDDEGDFQQAGIYEMDLYKNNVVSHKSGHAEPIKVTREQHPEWQKWKTVEENWTKMTKAEQASRRMLATQLYSRIEADTNRANTELREKRRQEAIGLDAPRLTQEAREKVAQLTSTYVDSEIGKIQAGTQDADPDKKKQADFELKTSPATTMLYKDRDGKTNNQPLRDAVTSVAQLNPHISNDALVRYVMAVGSPVGFDKEGRPLPGMNDVGGKYIRGKGATQYKFVGSDANENMVVRMDDGQLVRIPPQTFYTLGKAREKGYKAAVDWMHADRAAKEEKGFGTRLLERIIPPKGFK